MATNTPQDNGCQLFYRQTESRNGAASLPKDTNTYAITYLNRSGRP